MDENIFLPSETDQLFQTLANSGFFVSTNKYNIGESIEVDFSCFYGEDGLKMSFEDQVNYADKKVNVVIKEVEKVLEKKLASLVNQDYTVVGGVDSIVNILNTVDRSTDGYTKGIIFEHKQNVTSYGRFKATPHNLPKKQKSDIIEV